MTMNVKKAITFRRLRLTPGTIAVIALLAVVAILTVYPLVILIYGSFIKEGPLSHIHTFTLEGYKVAYLNLMNLKVLWNTMWLAVVRTVLAISVAIFLAWVVARTDTPWRRFIEISIWTSLFIPLQPMVFAWILLLSPKSGIVNVFIRDALPFFHLNTGPFNVYSYGGIIWVSLLAWIAGSFVLIRPAMQRMDPSMEEAARMSGANLWGVFRRITMPLMKPAILGATVLAFVRLVGSFEIEVFLGIPAKIYVFTTKVWDYLSFSPAQYPEAMAMCSVIQLITLGLILLNWRLQGRTQYTTITGKGYIPRLTKLGKWKYITLGLCLLYVLLTVALPLGILTFASFFKVFGYFQARLLTLDNYRVIFSDNTTLPALKNTIILGLSSASIGMVFFALISYSIVKSKFSPVIKRSLDFFSYLPASTPPFVLALGFLWGFVGIGVFFSPLRFLGPLLYGSLYFFVIISLIRPMPPGVRAMNASFLQMGNELEEASWIHGGSWIYTFRRIVVPMLSPAFVAAWIQIFLFVWRDLATYLLIYLPGSRLASISMFEYWQGGYTEAAISIGVITAWGSIPLAFLAQWMGARASGSSAEAY